jgi:tight adherence protein B
MTMSSDATTAALRVAAGGLWSLALFAFAREIAATGRYPGRALLVAYEAHLERTRRLLFLTMNPRAVMAAQAAGVALGGLAFAVTGQKLMLALVALALAGPQLYLAKARALRQGLFEQQADGFILALANSLKAISSIGGALQGLMPVLQNPVKQEIGLVLNELRLGSSLEHAMLGAAARARCVSFDAAVSALLIGRQVGGNLPKIFETTAASVREMARLEAFLRAKTSESRAQLNVLAAFPIGVVAAFKMLKPDYFTPLQTTAVGQIVIGIAIALWLGGIVLARKLSQVDL